MPTAVIAAVGAAGVLAAAYLWTGRPSSESPSVPTTLAPLVDAPEADLASPPPAPGGSTGRASASSPTGTGTPAPAPATTASVPGDGAAGAGALRIEIRATGACWVAATGDGTPVASRVLNAGDRVAFSVKTEAVLRVGMPGNITVAINDAPVKPFARPGTPTTLRITPANYRDLLTP